MTNLNAIAEKLEEAVKLLRDSGETCNGQDFDHDPSDEDFEKPINNFPVGFYVGQARRKGNGIKVQVATPSVANRNYGLTFEIGEVDQELLEKINESEQNRLSLAGTTQKYTDVFVQVSNYGQIIVSHGIVAQVFNQEDVWD